MSPIPPQPLDYATPERKRPNALWWVVPFTAVLALLTGLLVAFLLALSGMARD